MKANEIDANMIEFGIRMNFPPFCGQEVTNEVLKAFKDLERKAKLWEENKRYVEIGKAIEIAVDNGLKLREGNVYWSLEGLVKSVEKLEWAEGEE